LFTDKGIYTAYTEIKPQEKKSTEIYAGIIDQLSKNVGKFVARFCDNEGSS